MQLLKAGNCDGPAVRVREALALSGLIILTFAIHVLSPVTTSTDSAWTFHLAASILRQGNVDLDEYRPLMDLERDYRLRQIGGHIYYYYPAATPLLIAPVVLVANEVFVLTRATSLYAYLDTHAPDDRTARLEKLMAAGIVALATAGMYLVGRRFIGLGASIAVAAIFAFGSSMWSTASRALWQHGPSVLLLVVALYLALRFPRNGCGIFASGCILAFAYLVRPTNSLSLAFFGLYFLVNGGRRVWSFLIGAMAILGPYVIVNLATYSNIFPPYSYQLFERLATPAAFGEALVGTLLSPGRGLFIFSPILLFAIYGLRRGVVGGGLTRANLDLYLAGIIVSHWIVTSLFEDWGGAWSIGPRYFVEVIPYLAYFLIPVFRDDFLRGPFQKWAFIAALIFSVLVQLRSSVSPYPFMWNGKPKALVEAPERKWDWGDLQFLRGLCPDDPMEGRAPACWMRPLE